MSQIKILAVGDSFITQHIPDDEKMTDLRKYFMQHDVRFTNFEVLLHNFEVYPAPISGGTWACARPNVLEDLKKMGINVVAWANNHNIDWNIEGILTTKRHLDANLINAGVGKNLAEASQPRYIDTQQGRLALIGVTSTISEWGMASAQRPDVLGRPGANVLRYKAIHKVLPEELKQLKTIIEQTEINANRRLNEMEGFAKSAENGYFINNICIEADSVPGTITKMNEKDAERIVRMINEAKRQADNVIVSHHTHERKGLNKQLPADFACDFAHLCIDNGVDAYLGHGPHIWRGIEIYNKKPIFYSLGNFIFQNDLVEKQPTEFYDLYDLGAENTVADGLDIRSAKDTRGLAADRRVFESAAVSFSIEDGKISQIELKPLSLGFKNGRARRGRPEFANVVDGTRILEEIAKLSAEYGTQIKIDNNKGIINI
ncbi:CapA family protein [Pectinatus sottacetonis]|uniref:CapA family protein n=1 Tax=Pectinatus sottacetonis TaxID=1002795 RepID=UPI0018C63AB9|nr:CapA family protein [Pectinatus sottacetonis]